MKSLMKLATRTLITQAAVVATSIFLAGCELTIYQDGKSQTTDELEAKGPTAGVNPGTTPGNSPDSGSTTESNSTPAAAEIVLSSSVLSLSAGNSAQVTFTAKSADQQVLPSYSGTLTFSSTDPQAILPSPRTFSASDGGVAQFSITFRTAGIHSVTVSDGKLSRTLTGITVTHAGSASSISFSQQPAGLGVAAGSAFSTQPMILAVDAYGNPVPSVSVNLTAYSDSTCTNAVTAATLSNGSSTSSSSGIAAFSGVSLNKATPSLYLKASSGLLITCASTSLSVVPAAVSSVTFSQEAGGANVPAGSAFNLQPKVLVKDSYDNLISGQSVSLSAFTDSNCTVEADGTLNNESASSAADGVATFAGVNYRKAESVYLKASAGTVSSNCSTSAISIVAAPAASVVFTQQPSAVSLAAGSAFTTQPKALVKDAHNNAVIGASVALSAFTNPTCGSTASGTLQNLTATTDNDGIATFSSVSYTKAETIYFKAGVGSVFSDCSTGSISQVAAPAATLSFSQNAAGTNVTAGSHFTTQPKALLVDTYSNARPGESIALSAYTDSTCQSPATGTLSNASAITDSAGVATFADVSYTKSETIYLKLSNGTLHSGCLSTGISVVPAELHELSFSQQPSGTGITPGSAFTTVPKVLAKDSFDNVIPSLTLSMSAFTDNSCSTAPVSGTLSNASAITDSSGVATFNGMSFSAENSLYLKASASSVDICSTGTVSTISNFVLSAVTPGTLGFGGGAIALSGTGFQAGATVTIGTSSVCSSPSVNSLGTIIQCTAPLLAAGTYDIKVTNPNSSTQTLAAGLVFAPLTALTMCTPSTSQTTTIGAGTLHDSGGSGGFYSNNQNCNLKITAPAGQSYIYINFFGSFSVQANNDYVKIFDGTDATGTPLHTGSGFSGTTLPPAVIASSGSAYIVFTSNSSTTGSGFMLNWTSSSIAPILNPTLTSISPNAGSPDGGTTVTLTGTNFSTAGVSVTIGGVACSVTNVTSTQVTCTTGAHSLGAETVVLANNNTALAASIVNGYSYSIAPTLTSVSPPFSSTSGGTALTIVGENFDTGGVQVLIGGTSSCTSPTITPTQITCNSSSKTAGTYNVQIKNTRINLTSNTLSSAIVYTTVPAITSFSPSTLNTVGGSFITITGTNLSAVELHAELVGGGNTYRCPIRILGTTSIECEAPAMPEGSYKIRVTHRSSGGAYGESVSSITAIANGFDTTFGAYGIKKIKPTQVYNFGYGKSVVIDSNGKFIVGGYVLVGSYKKAFVARLNDDGTLDDTFGVGGKVTLNITDMHDETNKLMLDGSGKILLVGSTQYDLDTNYDRRAFVARLNTDGSLDSTFNSDGIYLTSTLLTGNDLEIDSDGKLILGGAGDSTFALQRLTSAGELDTTFGTSGTYSTAGSSASAIALDNADNIFACVGGGATINVWKVTAAGALDTAFATAGKYSYDYATGTYGWEYCTDIAVDSNGKVIVGASVGRPSSYPSSSGLYAFLRLTSAGAIDTTFGVSGMRAIEASDKQDDLERIYVTAGNEVFGMGGYAGSSSSNGVANVVKLTSSGAVDTSFSGDGILPTAQESIYGATVDSSGTLFLVGNRIWGNPQNSDSFIRTLTLAKVNSAGVIQTTWGASGYAMVEGGSAYTDKLIYDVIKTNGGKFVILSKSGRCWTLTRLTSALAIDTTFGTDGYASYCFSGYYSYPSVVREDSSGNLFIGGEHVVSNYTDMAVIKFNSSGALVTSFGTSGLAIVSVCTQPETLRDILFVASSKLLLVGACQSVSYSLTMARFSSAGALDTTFGTSGKLTTSVTSTSYSSAVSPTGFPAIAIGPTSGSIYIAGRTKVTKFSVSGTQDTSFGTSGVYTVSPTMPHINQILIDNTESIITMIGDVGNNSTIMQITSNGGGLVTSFGSSSSGYTSTSFATSEAYRGVAKLSDNRYIAVGAAYNSDFSHYIGTIALFTSAGTLDTSFNSIGYLNLSYSRIQQGSRAYKVLLDADGEPLVFGTTAQGEWFVLKLNLN